MTKLTIKQKEEFFFILKREEAKLEQIFKSIKLKDSKFSETFKFMKSYYDDMKFFMKKNEHVKAFELQNYVWGILDSLAINKAIEVPKELQKHFKAEF
jgi:hypothetical protein